MIWRNPSFLFLCIIGTLALGAPGIAFVTGIDPSAINLFDRLAPPSGKHILGTDELGRDLFLRLLYGARVSLAIGVAAAITSALIGSVIGLIAGYFGNMTDKILMRITDSIIALPLLPLLIVLSALDPQKIGLPLSVSSSQHFSLIKIVVIISLFGWPLSARLVRAGTLQIKSCDFIRAAQALGLSHARIMLRHIFPNVTGPLIVATTLSVGNAILMESTLSFLGLGISPPTPSWGNMLTTAQDMIWDSPAAALWPGIMIFLTVMAFNFLGDRLCETFDPKQVRRQTKSEPA